MTTVTTWLVHCVTIAVVLSVGALAWELSARWSGRSVRFVWLGALAGSVTLPWLMRLVPQRVVADVVPIPLSAMPSVTTPVLVPEVGGVLAGDALVVMDSAAATYGLTAWVLLSLAVLGYITFMLVAVQRARRSWRAAEVEGTQVWVTRNTGPAALGLRAGMVVLPTWALQLAADLRSLLLLHEREHVRAGDPRVLFGGLLLVAAMPWNPLVWYQLLRLRNAIELDCDARVLRRGIDPRAYGALLLEVGRRRGSSPLVMATFAEPRLFLEERIRRIAKWPLERRPRRAAGFAVAAAVLFATALSAGDALRPVVLVVAESADDAMPPVSGALLDALGAPTGRTGLPTGHPRGIPMVSDTPPANPTFTPMTQRPELRNRERVTASLEANYPPLLRDAGIGGTAAVWFYIDEDGVVQRTLISKPSGYPALDEAALKVASEMEFSPARNRDVRVPVWVEIPVKFTTPQAEQRAREQRATGDREATAQREAEAARREAEAAAAAARRQAGAAESRPPVRTGAAEEVQPRRISPELINADGVAAALVRAYPPLLRDAGITGTVTVWYYVGTDGRVLRAQIASSSGHPALDEAAISVANVMRFSPPVVDGRPAEVWVELPISFGGARVVRERRDGVIQLAPVVVPGSARSEREAVPTPSAAQPAAMAAGSPPPPPPPPARGQGALPADSAAQLMAVRGFQATQAGRHDEALQAYATARQTARADRTIAMINFFHGYTLLKLGEPIIREGNSAEAGRRALPVFRQAKTMLEGAAAYTEQAQTRQQLLQQVDQFIEVSEALIRRGTAAASAAERGSAAQQSAAEQQAAARRAAAEAPADRQAAPRPSTGLPPQPPPAGQGELASAPTFTPMTQRPELLNVREIQRLLIANYPPMLRDAGIGGSPVLWFFVDDEGRTVKVQLSRSSGHPALDEAALAVASQMQHWRPAVNRDRPVSVWIEVPIVFTAR